MKQGSVKAELAASLAGAEQVFGYSGGIGWNLEETLAPLGSRVTVRSDLELLIEDIASAARPGDRVLVMSNGGFGGIHQRLLDRLARQTAVT
jgi:UDP-N-acetylmuramate: L-alanyl-gamma-D-glutamyl-meso-diaminopimelate ligase